MPFMDFLVHSYTCCSDRHASPYWTSIRRWISMGFTPSLLKKRTTEHCSFLMHVASEAAIFTLLLRRRVAFLHRTATCRPLSKPWVSLLSTYKTVELCFEFLSRFKDFHLTLSRRYARNAPRINPLQHAWLYKNRSNLSLLWMSARLIYLLLCSLVTIMDRWVESDGQNVAICTQLQPPKYYVCCKYLIQTEARRKNQRNKNFRILHLVSDIYPAD